MIQLIEALNFRCLKYIHQPLGDFHVLVGPNASGKTTFLDVIVFLSDLLNKDLDGAVQERSQNIKDLIWGKAGDRFELAVELGIPTHLRGRLEKPEYNAVRYEVSIGFNEETSENFIFSEKVLLKKSNEVPPMSKHRDMFPQEWSTPPSIITPKGSRNIKTVVNKVFGGNDNFYDETGKGWDHSFKLGRQRSAFRSLPEDESKFPVSTWLKNLLNLGVQKLVLNSSLMRIPSPPGQATVFLPNGSNIPWIIDDLIKKNPERYREWIQHLKSALPDLRKINTIERPEDRHRYLVVCYENNLEIPSWMVSDGTLRLFALTLPAYLPDLEGIYLIEEPENGIHPPAIETAFQSLSSVYHAQILMASHSPVILSIADSSKVLCFSKTASGATDIVLGSEHPALRDWKGETNLGVLFAGGVLG